jgi:putative heme-binding domain-containing protein
MPLMSRVKIRAGIAVAWCLCASALAQEDPFASQVRPTDPLSPREQRETFRVPPGFEVQLFASEPDLLKPMNLAFDARGRLWVSMSREYPYAAPLERPGRDMIKILEDTTGDGTADKITTFADGLNIPIGLYPYKNGVIAWSIPNIWFLEDTDGDDVCDKRTVLYGPMGYERDTHGMNNGFTRGFDGWLYACHGFNNQTTVKGADGHEITMQSGNTYRMRLHGERIEQYTWGQVNPFGMTIDEWGNLFTADCHSKPIYQLVREGYYPSFGKPHDGLGFVPQMMEHSHGSTAIAGVAIVSGEGFPPEYRGDAFVGNVMTSRINRDRLDRIGASVKAVEQPDFLSSTDPWFRPVDLQYGPDDALYVADFYNRIIGHYEVPLDHPGRDRTSGRIWRIVYRGKDAAGSAKRLPDLSRLSIEELIEQLSSSNLAKRMLITDWLSDSVGQPAVEPLRKAVATSNSPARTTHAMWTLLRLGEADSIDWDRLLRDPSPLVRSHAVKALGQQPEGNPLVQSAIRSRLSDRNAFVRREVAEALGRRKFEADSLHGLNHLWQAGERNDPILMQSAKIALRNLLGRPGALESLEPSRLESGIAARVATACLGLRSEASGEYLLAYLRQHPTLVAESSEYVEHAVKRLPGPRKVETIALIRGQLAERVELQYLLFNSVMAGLGRPAAQRSDEMKDWAAALVTALGQTVREEPSSWSLHPEPENPRSPTPWGLQERQASDGRTIRVLSSFPHGERLTGIARSVPFAAPRSFSFELCGHRGFPDQPPHERNVVHLRDAENDRILRTVYPPRNDRARKIEWDLSELQGRSVYLEAIDGDPGGAYAWLALGRFAPPVIDVPRHSPEQTSRWVGWIATLVGDFSLKEFEPQLRDAWQLPSLDGLARQSVARALLRFHPDANLAALATILDDADVSPAVRQRLLEAFADLPHPDSDKLLRETVIDVPRERQAEIALELASSREGSETLLALIEQGKISPRHLQSENLLSRLRAGGLPRLEKRVVELTRNLPSIKQELRELIQQRQARYASAETSRERGRALFEKHCQNCHRIGDRGELVGPQLDGIGNRGLERLLEDVLDPNQNVDVAFHTMTIVLTDGKVLTGLFRREDDGVWILADNKGKEFRVAASDVEESVKSPLSLMPENVARDLNEQEFFDMVRFLLEQTAQTPAAAE